MPISILSSMSPSINPSAQPPNPPNPLPPKPPNTSHTLVLPLFRVKTQSLFPSCPSPFPHTSSLFIDDDKFHNTTGCAAKNETRDAPVHDSAKNHE